MDVITVKPKVVNLAASYAAFALHRVDALLSPDGSVTLYKFNTNVPTECIHLTAEQVKRVIGAHAEMQAAIEAEAEASAASLKQVPA